MLLAIEQKGRRPCGLCEGITWVLSYFPDECFCDFEIYMLISIGRARVLSSSCIALKMRNRTVRFRTVRSSKCVRDRALRDAVCAMLCLIV